MAIQLDVPADGGLTARNAYVRLGPVMIKKDREADEFYLTADIEVYKDSAEAGKENPQRVESRHVDRFKMRPIDPAATTLATVYTGLKDWLVAQGIVSSTSDILDV